MNLASLDVRHGFIQQSGEHTDQASLGLAPQSQEDEIVSRKDCIYHLRHDRIFVTEDAGKKGLPALNSTYQIIPEFVFNGSVTKFGFRIRTLT